MEYVLTLDGMMQESGHNSDTSLNSEGCRASFHVAIFKVSEMTKDSWRGGVMIIERLAKKVSNHTLPFVEVSGRAIHLGTTFSLPKRFTNLNLPTAIVSSIINTQVGVEDCCQSCRKVVWNLPI